MSEETGKLIKEYRKRAGLTQKQLSECTGIAEPTIRKYESGRLNPKVETLQKIADALGVDVCTIADWDLAGRIIEDDVARKQRLWRLPGISEPPAMIRRPLLGTIACGQPILATQNVADYVDVPADVNCDFVLRCKGDSMIDAHIMDGALVYCREAAEVENGEIAAVIVDSEEATLKRWYVSGDSVTLVPANGRYAPMIFHADEILRLRLLGKVVAWTNYAGGGAL